MKKFVSLCLGLLLVVSSYAQTFQIQKVKRTYKGNLQRGLVRRDMTAYPNTTQGNTAFFAQLNSGCLSITLSSGVTTPIASGCSSPGSTTTAISYSRVFIAGNSITHHPPMSDWRSGSADWGMDASAANKDYKHILTAYLQTLNPSVVVREFMDFPPRNIAEGPYWESAYWNLDGGLSRYDGVAAWQPDLIIMRLSENITDPTHGLANNYKDLIDKLRSQSPNARIILTTSVWNQADVSSIITAVGAERGYPVANLNNITGGQSGYAGHPNDAAMQTIADRIWAVIPKTIVTTPPSSTTAAPTLAGGFAEGTVSELMALAPFVPTTNQISSWPTGNTTQYLNNGTIKLGLLKSVGASLSHLSVNGGANLINTNVNGWSTTFEGAAAPDVGRSAGLSLYAYPDGFKGANNGRFVDINDYGQTQTSSTIGWNAVQGGSGSQDHSPILWYERRTIGGVNYIYTKTQPYQWGMTAVKSKMYIHNWWWLDGPVARHYTILENFRTDSQQLYWAREQELPFAYPIAPLYRKVTYTGTAPFTGGSLTYYDLAQPVEGGGSNNQNDTGAFNSSENWVGAVNDNNTMGVFMITPFNNRFRGKQFQSWGGDSTTNASSYINSSVMLNFDHPQNLAYTGSFYPGSLSSFRTYINSNPPAAMPFSWTFTGTRTNGWWSENGAARIIDGRYQFNIGFGRPGDVGTPLEGTTVHFATFASPFGAWKASDIPTIYIKGRFTSTNITNLKLVWRKPGAENGGAEYEKAFTAAATSAEQTIAIPMSGTANWSGIISNIKFKLSDFTQNTAGSEMFIPSYIGFVNPN